MSKSNNVKTAILNTFLDCSLRMLTQKCNLVLHLISRHTKFLCKRVNRAQPSPPYLTLIYAYFPFSSDRYLRNNNISPLVKGVFQNNNDLINLYVWHPTLFLLHILKRFFVFVHEFPLIGFMYEHDNAFWVGLYLHPLCKIFIVWTFMKLTRRAW